MERETGTIFKVYLLAESGEGKEEGFVQLWKHKGKLQRQKKVPFNSLDRIGARIRERLKAASIEWPPH